MKIDLMRTSYHYKMKSKKIKYAVLVYQAGIANVFAVECLNLGTTGRNARRLLQSSFQHCESFCNGIAVAGIPVMSCSCNMAGDIIDFPWNADLSEQPFSDEFFPVFSKVNSDYYLGNRNRS